MIAQLRQVQTIIEMRKQIAPARGLPAQGRSEVFSLEPGYHQPVDRAEIPPRRLLGLRRGREMNEAVREIDRGASEFAGGLSPAPFLGGQQFVDRGQVPAPSSSPRRKNTQRGAESFDFGGEYTASSHATCSPDMRKTQAVASGKLSIRRSTSSIGAPP